MWRSRSQKWSLICPFFFIILIHSIAIFLFTRGFLLTRTELPHSSNCSDIAQCPCVSLPRDEDNPLPNQTCWTESSIDRLVIIVLDALRYDFVAPSTFFKDKKPWMDKLPVLQKLASEPGLSSRIFKAIADPPTTSLQRLKGLTTGGLPTFIDVGNSFGAPAIVEDNLIQQLVQSGKRVVMMGDDTWLQLFPHHFEKSFPYPSFNVKDLDTVDNGCIEHLLPSLYEENWDVLIAHFLGVDHAGHIFGVNTIPMIQKLEQYNNILEKVVEALKAQSGPGGLHENTFLLVMGDHGQTLNGDHGGGSPEEVETSIFAMSFKEYRFALPSELDVSACGVNLDGKKICISYLEQVDFAVTVSAMLGVPFPFGSIGRVNPRLYFLGAGSLFSKCNDMKGCENSSYLEEWMQHYVNVLCINAWQVKRYLDVYTASSVIGFGSEDLLRVADVYSHAQGYWSDVGKDSSSCTMGCYDSLLPAMKMQVDAYLKFLDSVIELARSKWTEFNLKLMGVGLSVIFASLFIQLIAIKRLNKFCGSSFLSAGHTEDSANLILALIVVLIRACSFLSNSYILEEGKVAMYFLATIGILELRYSIMTMKLLSEATLSLILVCVLRFIMEFGLSKQAASSLDLASILEIAQHHRVLMYWSLILPILPMILLAYLSHKCVAGRSERRIQIYVVNGSIFCYMLIASHWVVESKVIHVPLLLQHIGRNCIPRLIYAAGFSQLASLGLGCLFCRSTTSDYQRDLIVNTVAMLSACSSTIILLLGRQGFLIAVATIVAAWCIMRLKNLRPAIGNGTSSNLTFYLLPVTKWNLLAVCLFFCTGHWCAFDGLRYGAAFIGFDEFILVRQAILLAIDTFGFSHILPIFGLPLLVAYRFPNEQINAGKVSIFLQLSQVYLMYGFLTSISATFSTLCVAIHRRHLMVWGLFAPNLKHHNMNHFQQALTSKMISKTSMDGSPARYPTPVQSGTHLLHSGRSIYLISLPQPERFGAAIRQ
ncbi:hypothetical protein Nepgr_021593 [Nepenthes gracilis]|uniref:GPI ethanolamine phosphate transferase 3 n=1 Tax=Nepenthes gracilis TaxID=150966 RepID=A0AAD3XW25_NEPGR|nr:hypothetical protein Nepgr_021593 [Nepenthes gracilis]